jgi:hypothetical protein
MSRCTVQMTASGVESGPSPTLTAGCTRSRIGTASGPARRLSAPSAGRHYGPPRRLRGLRRSRVVAAPCGCRGRSVVGTNPRELDDRGINRRRRSLGDIPVIGGALQARYQHDRRRSRTSAFEIYPAAAADVDQPGKFSAHHSMGGRRIQRGDDKKQKDASAKGGEPTRLSRVLPHATNTISTMFDRR